MKNISKEMISDYDKKMELGKKLRELCRQKGFSKEDFGVFLFLPFCKDAVKTYGSVVKALEEAITTANEYDDIDTIIAEYCEKIGI